MLGLADGWRPAPPAFAAALPLTRAMQPHQTLARILPILHAHGITRLSRITRLDELGIPVWSAVRPNARTLAVSQGKGMDDDSARVSAAMEALELATAEEPPVKAMMASESRLARAGVDHDALPSLLRPGRPPSPDRDRAWYRARDLATGRPVLVPADAVRVDSSRDLDGAEADYWQSSDGLASGNTLEEAVLQALLERIERDATALWTLAGPDELRARCIEPRHLGNAGLDALLARIEAAGLRLRLFDISSDIGIPCHYCVLGPEATPPRRLFDLAAGAGCHLTAAGSAIRAVLEAAQSRLTVIAGLRDDFLPSDYAATPDLSLLDYLAAVPTPPRPAEEVCASWAGLLGRLAAVGVARVLAVPLTGSGSPFVVAKVFAEGLEHPPGARAARFGRRALRRMMALQ